MSKDRGLSAQQERFCQEYALNGKNGTKAAIAAGYSEKSAAVTACRLLKNDKITSRVRELIKDQWDHLIITKEQVLLDTYTLAEKNRVVDPKTAIKALELVGKELGMFGDRVEHSGQIDTQQGVLAEILDQMRETGGG